MYSDERETGLVDTVISKYSSWYPLPPRPLELRSVFLCTDLLKLLKRRLTVTFLENTVQTNNNKNPYFRQATVDVMARFTLFY